MATIARTKERNWGAQVQRKGKYASPIFRLKGLASEWVAETERLIDIGCEPSSRKIGTPGTMADLVNLHISDLQEVGKPIRRSKQAVLDALKRNIGATRISNLNRYAFIKYGKLRAKQGAEPVTLSVDLSYIHTVLTHAAAVHGIKTNTENLRLARIALARASRARQKLNQNRKKTTTKTTHSCKTRCFKSAEKLCKSRAFWVFIGNYRGRTGS